MSREDVFGRAVVESKCKQILRAICRQHDSSVPLPELCLLSLSPESMPQCKMVDAATGSMRDVDFKPSAAAEKWQRVQTNFVLDVPIAFSRENTDDALLLKKAEMAIDKVENSVAKSVFLHNNNAFRKGEELLNVKLQKAESAKSPKSGGKGKKGRRQLEEEEEDEEDEDTKLHELQIILDDIDAGRVEDCEVTPSFSRMRMAGKMFACAYLHSRATVAEAEAALRTDLLRSLKGRTQMHCDSLTGEETVGSESEVCTIVFLAISLAKRASLQRGFFQVPILHEPPRRILIKLPHSSVQISDYLFPGETPEDSTDSVKEIFGFAPCAEYMDDELELVAGPRESMVRYVWSGLESTTF